MIHPQFFIKLKTLFFCSLFIFLCEFSYGKSSPAEEIKNDTVPDQTVKPLPKLKIGGQIGYGYMFDRGNNGSFIVAKNIDLKNCLSYGADLSYYFSKYVGMGIKYNGIYTKIILPKNYLIEVPDGTVFIFPEKIEIYYIGVFCAVRYFVVPNKHCLFVNAGVGYALLRSKILSNSLYSDRWVGSDHTVAFYPEIGYDFFVS